MSSEKYQKLSGRLKKPYKKALENSRKNYESPFSSLNAIFSDEKKLYTYNRFYDEKKILSLKSVCYKDSPYYMMVYSIGENELVILRRSFGGAVGGSSLETDSL